MLSPLAPRYYSISSSPLRDPRHLSITVAVVNAPARSGRGDFTGVCSSYLAVQPVGSVVHAFVKDTRSAFRLPADPAAPIIMVGPGTGLAPFRGFLQERAALRDKGDPIGPALLFFGCRHPGQDHLYAEELAAFAADGVSEIDTAFSRRDPGRKIYVQDRILESKDRVWRVLQDGATVYVCGDATRMAPDVRRAFATIYRGATGGGDAAAEDWLTRLAAENRYLVDVWAAT